MLSFRQFLENQFRTSGTRRGKSRNDPVMTPTKSTDAHELLMDLLDSPEGIIKSKLKHPMIRKRVLDYIRKDVLLWHKYGELINQVLTSIDVDKNKEEQERERIFLIKQQKERREERRRRKDSENRRNWWNQF